MPDNILRVGAEFDVAPLIAGAQQVGDSLQVMAQKFIASGLTATQAASALQNLGYTATQAAQATQTTTTAVAGTANATAQLTTQAVQGTAQVTQLTAAINQLVAALQAQAAALSASGGAAASAATSTAGLINASAAARVELGALSGSAGAAEFGLARIAGQSALLAPIIRGAFPVLAVLAFVEILAQAAKTLEEWSELAQKSADAQAAFAREMDKSAESLDRERAALAGLSGQAAENAVELAQLGDKSADLSGQVKSLNERLADQPGILKSLKEAVGSGAVDAYHLFDDAAERAEESSEDFNHQIADTVLKSKDLPAALDEINTHIRALQETFDNPALTAYSEATQANLARQIDLYKQWAQSIQNTIAAEDLSAEVLTEKNNKAIFESDQKLALDRIALNEQETETLLRANTITAEQARDAMLKFSEEKTRILEEGLARDRALLSAQEKANPKADFSAQEAELASRAKQIEIDAEKEKLRIASQAAEEIKRRDQERALSAIETAQVEINAADKVGESYARLKLTQAQSKPEITAASVELEQRLTRTYEDQITALRQKAEALKASDPVGNERQIAELNAQAIALDAAKEEAIGQLHQDAQTRIREIDKQALSDQLASGNDAIAKLSGSYQNEVIKFQTALAQKKLSMGNYVADIDALAAQQFESTVRLLEQEAKAVQDAAARRVISEQDAAARIAAIRKQETEAFLTEQKREEEAAKQAAEKEMQIIKQVSASIARDFVGAFNQIVTGHERVGQAALKLGEQLELYLIDEGIKKIVVKYATELLQMLAAHSSFLANLMGLQTAGDAEQVARAKVVQEAIVADEAGEAYAAAFASVMAALPFPENLATAPGVASAAFAQTMAGGSFQMGGIVPKDMVAVVHEGEGVFTPGETQNIQSIASQSRTSNATHIAMENHFHKTGDLSEAAISRMMRRAVRRGSISARSFH